MSADPAAGSPGTAGVGGAPGTAGVAGGRTPDEVRRALAERIGSGRFRPGQRLGAERALAAELGVSRASGRAVTGRPRVIELRAQAAG